MRVIKAILLRNLKVFFSNVGRIIGTLIMPVFMMLTCSFVMNGAKDIDSPMNYLIAGVCIMIVFQGALNNSTAVLNDIASGFMREIIVAPIDRRCVAIGNMLSASLLATFQGLLALVLGFAVGFRTTVAGFLIMVALMMLAGLILSAMGLFFSLTAKNQTNFQMISMFAVFPAMFLSGAYIPTTILPKFLLPIVYINPLTYLTSTFRYVSLGMNDLSDDELVRQGVAYRFGSITITPAVTWIFVLAIGAVFFSLCVYKFRKVNFAEIKGRTMSRR